MITDIDAKISADLNSLYCVGRYGIHQINYLQYKNMVNSDDFLNKVGQAIYDMMSHGYFDYIISNQKVISNTIFIDIDFELLTVIIKYVSFYCDSTDYAITCILSEKPFLENKEKVELEFYIDCMYEEKFKHLVFNNVKSEYSDKEIVKLIEKRMFDT